jgi:hypothetical protein
MEKIIFKDFPDLTTPLNADNLNQLQTNIENALDEKIDKSNLIEMVTDSKKEKANASLSLGAGDTYQIPDFPELKKILFMEIFLYTAGNPSIGSGNFIYPGSGYNYLVASSDLTGTYKGVYVSITNTGLIAVSSYRHGGVNVKGYRIIYLDI